MIHVQESEIALHKDVCVMQNESLGVIALLLLLHH